MIWVTLSERTSLSGKFIALSFCGFILIVLSNAGSFPGKHMKNIAVVTGAEGFIGSHLVRFLHAEGWKVIGTFCIQGSLSAPKSPNLEFARCDLRNGQRIGQVLAKYQPTHVFHLGAQSLPTLSWEDPVWTFESNIMGSLNLFEAMRHMKR